MAQNATPALSTIDVSLIPRPLLCSDLEFLQLEWMVTALHPHGIPVLLLNKFLTLGRRGARQGAGLADAQVPA